MEDRPDEGPEARHHKSTCRPHAFNSISEGLGTAQRRGVTAASGVWIHAGREAPQISETHGGPRPLPHRVSELEHCSKDHAGPHNVQAVDKSVRASEGQTAVNDASRYIVGICLPNMFLFRPGARVTGARAPDEGACSGRTGSHALQDFEPRGVQACLAAAVVASPGGRARLLGRRPGDRSRGGFGFPLGQQREDDATTPGAR